MHQTWKAIFFNTEQSLLNHFLLDRLPPFKTVVMVFPIDRKTSHQQRLSDKSSAAENYWCRKIKQSAQIRLFRTMILQSIIPSLESRLSDACKTDLDRLLVAADKQLFVKRSSSCDNRYEKPSSFSCGRIAPVTFHRRPQPKLRINWHSSRSPSLPALGNLPSHLAQRSHWTQKCGVMAKSLQVIDSETLSSYFG